MRSDVTEHKVIDGEVVDAPRVLSAEPSTGRAELRCDTHPDWMDCQLSMPACVAFSGTATTTQPDGAAFRVTDRRRLSYPRLRPHEHPV